MSGSDGAVSGSDGGEGRTPEDRAQAPHQGRAQTSNEPDERDTAPMSGAGATSEGSQPRFDPLESIAVVTGAAGGIGAALVRALGAAGASVVVAADLDGDHVSRVAEVLDAESDRTRILGRALDVAERDATEALVEQIETDHGPIDLWCANAGIGTASGVDAEPAVWQRAWEVNVLGHVNAASVLLNRWRSRGGGHLLVTASAAGLLTNLGDAPYTVTKHAAVAFAEWVAITHGHEGVGVSCLCPQGVRTPMVFGDAADEFAGLRRGAGSDGHDGSDGQGRNAAQDAVDRDQALALQVVRLQGVIEPVDAARSALEALVQGRFLALPHPEVARYEAHRAADHDRWINGMRKLQAQLGSTPVGGDTLS